MSTQIQCILDLEDLEDCSDIEGEGLYPLECFKTWLAHPALQLHMCFLRLPCSVTDHDYIAHHRSAQMAW